MPPHGLSYLFATICAPVKCHACCVLLQYIDVVLYICSLLPIFSSHNSPDQPHHALSRRRLRFQHSMPGPTSTKRQQKIQKKKERVKKARGQAVSLSTSTSTLFALANLQQSPVFDPPPARVEDFSSPPAHPDDEFVTTTSSIDEFPVPQPPPPLPLRHRVIEPIEPPALSMAFLHDPGNGPRVRNVREFLKSRFAAPASVEHEYCAVFVNDEVLEALRAVLPEEMALVRLPVIDGRLDRKLQSDK